MLERFIKRYGPCVGISLPAIFRWKIEIWKAPQNYTIEEHSHPNVDIELIPLYGDGILLWRQKPDEEVARYAYIQEGKNILRRFSIPAGAIHSFQTSYTPFVFLNIERWYGKPTSASEDFKVTN